MENLRKSVIILAMISILFMLFSCSKEEINDEPIVESCTKVYVVSINTSGSDDFSTMGWFTK